jgi:hypothetical protein
MLSLARPTSNVRYPAAVSSASSPSILFFLIAACGACGPAPVPTSPPSPLDSAPDPVDEESDDRPFSEEEKRQSKGKLGGVWVSCWSAFQPESDPAASVERLAGACAKATSMKEIVPVRIGDQEGDSDPVERVTFHVGANRCWRVYGVGGPEVADLDVTVIDESGKVAASDSGPSRAVVIPARGPLCVERPGTYTLEIAVVQGRGKYAVQVLGD